MKRILCAAIYFDDEKFHDHQPKNITQGFVITGRRHHNCYATLKALDCIGYKSMKSIQGFLTSDDNFVNREEAFIIAKEAGQIISSRGNKLFSEDIY